MKRWIHAAQQYSTSLTVDTRELDLSNITNKEDVEDVIEDIASEVESYVPDKLSNLPLDLSISGPFDNYSGPFIGISLGVAGLGSSPKYSAFASLSLQDDGDGMLTLLPEEADRTLKSISLDYPETIKKLGNDYSWLRNKETSDLKGIPKDVMYYLSILNSFIQSKSRRATSIDDIIEDLENEYIFNRKLQKDNPRYYEDHKRYAQAVVDFITSNNLNINRLKKLGNMCEKYFNIKDPKYYMNEIQ